MSENPKIQIVAPSYLNIGGVFEENVEKTNQLYFLMSELGRLLWFNFLKCSQVYKIEFIKLSNDFFDAKGFHGIGILIVFCPAQICKKIKIKGLWRLVDESIEIAYVTEEDQKVYNKIFYKIKDAEKATFSIATYISDFVKDNAVSLTHFAEKIVIPIEE